VSTVHFTQDGGLGVLTLDNPPLNLIGQALTDDLVAAVHGTCIAGGFELALFWAAEGTMIGLPEVRLGIVPLAVVKRLARV
jgi:enoyl-CoA hydratase/carnithine racemase